MCSTIRYFMSFLIFWGTMFTTLLSAQQIIKTIPAPNYPYGLAYDGTNLWVGTSSTNSNKIWKIDPANGTVLGSITVPFIPPSGSYTVKALAWDGQYLWVFMDLPSAHHPDKFYKVNPNTGAVLKTLNSPENDYIGGMDYFDNHIWYSQYYANQVAGRDKIIKMDTTGVTVDTLDTQGEQPMGVAYDGNFVWCAEDTGFGATRQEMYAYDPVTGAYTGNFVRIPTASPRDMTYDGTYFWLVHYNTTNSLIYQFATQGGTPDIHLPVTSLNFGLSEIGQTKTLQLNILNVGTAALSINELQFSNPLFSHTVPAFPVTIPPGGSTTIGVTFTPQNYGIFTGTMNILSNDPVTPSVAVSLTGKGMYGNPYISFNATSHNFGSVWIPEEGLASWKLLIGNRGLQNLQISAFTFSDPVFYAGSNPPITIAPDDTAEVTLWFAPQQAISYSATLEIANNDPLQPTAVINLQGTGLGGPFDLGYAFWNYQIPPNPSTTYNEYRVLALKAINDITGDGVADVITASRNYWTIALNGASAGLASEVWRFSSYISSSSAGGIGNTNDLPPQQKALSIANDLNNDGFQDVVIGTGGGNEHVYALNGLNGNIIWSFGTDHPDSFNLGDITSVYVREDYNNDGVNDVVATGSGINDGAGGRRTVYCFNGTNGQILWQYFVGAMLRMVESIGDVNGNGSTDVVVGTGNGIANIYSIVGIDPEGPTGPTPIWSFPIGSGAGGGKEVLRYDIPGQTSDVIAGSYFGRVYRIDGETGIQVWLFNLGSSGINQLSLIEDVDGDGLDDILVCSFNSTFYCISGATGVPIWFKTVGNFSWSAQAIEDINGDGQQDVIMACRNDILYILDGSNGASLLEYPMNSGVLQGATLASVLPDIDNNGFDEILGAADNGKIVALSAGSACINGFLGDVTGDDLVNSTDGLVILSYDVGVNIPQAYLDRINLGFGDVTEEGLTNSTDALVLLSWEAGLPVPFPVGQPTCLPSEGLSDRMAASPARSGGQFAKYRGEILVSPGADNLLLSKGQEVDIPVVIDMANLASGGVKLGSFTAKLEWNPAELELLSYSGGGSAGFEQPVVNDTRATRGELRVANANPHGGEGRVNVLNLRFKALGNGKANLSLNFSAMAAAETFIDLRPYLKGSGENPAQTAENLPQTFAIENYPNPFNPATTIRYQLPEAVEVKLVVYNVLGQQVRVLVNERREAGYHQITWDGRNQAGAPVGSGIYIYRFQAGNFTKVNKMMLMK